MNRRWDADMTRQLLRLLTIAKCNLSRVLIAGAICHLVTLSPCHLVSRAAAHPVVGDHHDRTLQVSVAADHATGKVVVTVAYRLELNLLTAARDMAEFKDQVPPEWQRTDPDQFYAGFVRCYAPYLASYLLGTGDDAPLKFTMLEHKYTLRDEKGQLLGHVRFDLVFRATFQLRPGTRQRFALDEDENMAWKGRIDLSLTATGVEVQERVEPSVALKAKSPLDHQPGDFEKLRRVALTFSTAPKSAFTAGQEQTSPRTTDDGRRTTDHGPHEDDHADLLSLFLQSDHAVWLLLVLAGGIGAVHALTPGHGKTLVAAYLVGQRGTVWHALLLGVVTTVTHTGVVLVLALGLWLFFPTGMSAELQRQVQTGLGLVMGLVVAALGFWLLLQRLAGRADHIHIGGGHHHHDGHHHHHPAPPVGERVSWWGLVVLGMSGGIVPCWDAVAMLLVAVGMNLVWLALPLLLAFSAGLAGVLVLIGILVVQVRRFTDTRWGEGRLVRALPLVSAVCVMALGCWLCYASVGMNR